MAFKMKSSPVRLFSNLFKGLKAKKTGDIGKEMKSKYSGEAQRADKVARPGESEYQFKVRTRKARSKKAGQQAKIDPKSEVKIDPKVGMDRYTYKTTSKAKAKAKSTKPDWSKAPKVGTQARTDWYKKYNLALDPTTPGYKVPEDPPGDSITIVGPQGQGRQYAVDMKGNPINKKSPSKKRGYKMKRNK